MNEKINKVSYFPTTVLNGDKVVLAVLGSVVAVLFYT